MARSVWTFKLRPRAELEAQYKALSQRYTEDLADTDADLAEFLPYTRGKHEALAWVLGELRTSPLVGLVDVDVSDVKEIEREWEITQMMLHREVDMDPRGRDYVVGVEEALMWACGLADLPLA